MNCIYINIYHNIIRYLRDTGLASYSAKNIFKGLQINNTIKVLDLSHNGLGHKSAFGTDVMDEICLSIQCKNLGIIHLDISYNNFDYETMRKF